MSTNSGESVVSESEAARIIIDRGVHAHIHKSSLERTHTCYSVPFDRMDHYNNIAKHHGLIADFDRTYFSPLIELSRRYAIYLLDPSHWTNFSTVHFTLLEYDIESLGTLGMSEVLLGRTSCASSDVLIPPFVRELTAALIEDKRQAHLDRSCLSLSYQMLVHFMDGLELHYNTIIGVSDED